MSKSINKKYPKDWERTSPEDKFDNLQNPKHSKKLSKKQRALLLNEAEFEID